MQKELSPYLKQIYRLAVLVVAHENKHLNATARLHIDLAITQLKLLLGVFCNFATNQEREKIEYHTRRLTQLTARDLQRMANNKNLFPK